VLAKAQFVLIVLGHTAISFAAAVVTGMTFYLFWRPIIGRSRYTEAVNSPVVMILLLVFVTLWGLVIYTRWQDRRAFLAWVLPGLWTCDAVFNGSLQKLPSRAWLDDRVFFLFIGCAYSLGAIIGAAVVQNSDKSTTVTPK